jgi:hypothetical protein
VPAKKVNIVVGILMKCLVPKCRRKATRHHWPVPKANGGMFTVPLCRYHHNLAETQEPAIIDILVKRAPTYWADSSVWHKCQGQYYKWLEERRLENEKPSIQTVLQAEN